MTKNQKGKHILFAKFKKGITIKRRKANWSIKNKTLDRSSLKGWLKSISLKLSHSTTTFPCSLRFPPQITSINWITAVCDSSPAAAMVWLSTGSFRLCRKELLWVTLASHPQKQLPSPWPCAGLGIAVRFISWDRMVKSLRKAHWIFNFNALICKELRICLLLFLTGWAEPKQQWRAGDSQTLCLVQCDDGELAEKSTTLAKAWLLTFVHLCMQGAQGCSARAGEQSCCHCCHHHRHNSPSPSSQPRVLSESFNWWHCRSFYFKPENYFISFKGKGERPVTKVGSLCHECFSTIHYPLKKIVIHTQHIYTYIYICFQSIRLLLGYHYCVKLSWQYQHKAEVNCLVQFYLLVLQPHLWFSCWAWKIWGQGCQDSLCLAWSGEQEKPSGRGGSRVPLLLSHGHKPTYTLHHQRLSREIANSLKRILSHSRKPKKSQDIK